jgi:hypothetical protein
MESESRIKICSTSEFQTRNAVGQYVIPPSDSELTRIECKVLRVSRISGCCLLQLSFVSWLFTHVHRRSTLKLPTTALHIASPSLLYMFIMWDHSSVCIGCVMGNGRFWNGRYGAERPFPVTHPIYSCPYALHTSEFVLYSTWCSHGGGFGTWRRVDWYKFTKVWGEPTVTFSGTSVLKAWEKWIC